MPCWLIPTEMVLNHAWLRSYRIKMRMKQSVMPMTCNDSRSLNIAGTDEKNISTYIFQCCVSIDVQMTQEWDAHKGGWIWGQWPF